MSFKTVQFHLIDGSSNILTRSCYSFSGWNTQADGLGTSYADGAQYNTNSDVTLYAQWATTPL